MNGSRLWSVFLAYLLAFVAITLASLVAVVVVGGMYPDVPAEALLGGFPGLLAGAMASSTALIVTVLVVTRPLSPGALRLLPGRETGPALAVMILGVLALGQALDSFTVLARLDRQGSVVAIRKALRQAEGPELFVAVVVIGVLVGIAEEVFFRGFMQTRLAAIWRPTWAVVTTSACFGLLHLEWLHAVLAFCIGLYLGFLTELWGSTLPAVACHVINNAVFTVLTASAATLDAFWPNVGLAAACSIVFAACVVWLAWAARRVAPG